MATSGQDDGGESEPDWEALDPYEAMSVESSTSDDKGDNLDIVMWEDPIHDEGDEFSALVWQNPGNPLCLVLYEFRARGLWRLPLETVHQVLPEGGKTRTKLNRLLPVDAIELAAQQPRRVSQEGVFWIKDNGVLPTVSTVQIVIPATEINPGQGEQTSHPKATLQATRKVVAALAFALAQEQADCRGDDGKPKPGKSNATGDTGIVGHLRKNNLTDLSGSSLQTYISKAIKDFPPPPDNS